MPIAVGVGGMTIRVTLVTSVLVGCEQATDIIPRVLVEMRRVKSKFILFHS